MGWGKHTEKLTGILRVFFRIFEKLFGPFRAVFGRFVAGEFRIRLDLEIPRRMHYSKARKLPPGPVW